MPHFPKPFYRKSRGRWYVEIGGKQVNLGPEKEAAFRRYHELMAEPQKVKQADADAHDELGLRDVADASDVVGVEVRDHRGAHDKARVLRLRKTLECQHPGDHDQRHDRQCDAISVDGCCGQVHERRRRI